VSKRKTSRNTRSHQRIRRLSPVTMVCIVIVLAIITYFGYTEIFHPKSHNDLSDGEAAVHFIDVGQGDSVLIQTTEGSVLIDGGNTNMGSRVVEYLRDVGVAEIAYVVATHPHADHIGGLVTVLGEFPIETLIMPNVVHDSRTFERFLDVVEQRDIPLREPIVGSSFYVGEAEFTIIAPNSTVYQNLNDYSVSLRMQLGNTVFIFTGDAERQSELEMTQHFISADVLHIGHHGSNTSTTQEFLDAVSPTIAVINVGENTYGHPSSDVLDRLSNSGVYSIYRSDYHGDIVIVTDGFSLSIRSQYNAVHN